MSGAHIVKASVIRSADSIKRLKRAAGLFRFALREIFDEAAYRRFLSRTEMSSSRAAYAAFQRERERLKSRPMKCC
jgi:hypothetical protein